MQKERYICSGQAIYSELFFAGAIEAPAYLSVILIYAKFGRQSSATALLVFAAIAVGATAFIAASKTTTNQNRVLFEHLARVTSHPLQTKRR